MSDTFDGRKAADNLIKTVELLCEKNVESVGILKDSMLVTANLNESLIIILNASLKEEELFLTKALDIFNPTVINSLSDMEGLDAVTFTMEVITTHIKQLSQMKTLVNECKTEQLEHSDRITRFRDSISEGGYSHAGD